MPQMMPEKGRPLRLGSFRMLFVRPALDEYKCPAIRESPVKLASTVPRKNTEIF